MLSSVEKYVTCTYDVILCSDAFIYVHEKSRFNCIDLFVCALMKLRYGAISLQHPMQVFPVAITVA